MLCRYPMNTVRSPIIIKHSRLVLEISFHAGLFYNDGKVLLSPLPTISLALMVLELLEFLHPFRFVQMPRTIVNLTNEHTRSHPRKLFGSVGIAVNLGRQSSTSRDANSSRRRQKCANWSIDENLFD